jgi:arginine exporter protein ArgO
MNSEVAKTIATCGVWLATACILTFGGVFKLTGDIMALLVMMGVPAIVAYAAMEATKAIWRSGEVEKPSEAMPTTRPVSVNPEAK